LEGKVSLSKEGEEEKKGEIGRGIFVAGVTVSKEDKRSARTVVAVLADLGGKNVALSQQTRLNSG